LKRNFAEPITMETDAVLILWFCRSEVKMLKRRNTILSYVLPWMSMNISRRTTMGRHVVYTGKTRKEYKISVPKSEGRRRIWRHKRKYDTLLK